MKKRLIKAIFTLVVVDLLLILVANISLCLFFDKQLREQDNEVYNQIIKTLTKPVEKNLNLTAEYEKQRQLNKLRFFVNGYQGSAIFTPGCFGLYDCKTGDTICESNESLILVISDMRKGENDGVVYFCSILNQEEVSEFLLKHKNDDVSVKSVSKKNLDCYITEIIASNMENGDIIEEKYVFEFENPEYETLIASENVSLFAPMNNSPEALGYNGNFYKYYTSTDARNKVRFDKINKPGPIIIDSSEESVIKWFYFSPNGDSYRTHTQKIYAPDGNVYNYVSAFSFNVKELTLNVVLVLIALSVVIAAVIFIIAEKIRRTKEKAKQATEDYRKNLMDIMAHDLKSPLTVIFGYAESLKTNVNEDKREYYAQAIMNNVESMNQSIESILVLSEIEKAKDIPVKDEVSLSEIIKSSFTSFEHIMTQKELSYTCKGEMKLSCNRELFERMINNLVLNAVTYAASHSVIEINMTDKELTISNLTDNCTDINCDDLVRPFVRGDKNRSGAKGNGLGLAIADNIAKYHNMKLNIKIIDGRFTVEIR